MPQVDTQQDYELISLTEEDGKTIMKMKRKFDTCDSEDNKIEVSKLSLHFFFLFSNSQLLRKSGLVPGSMARKFQWQVPRDTLGFFFLQQGFYVCMY